MATPRPTAAALPAAGAASVLPLFSTTLFFSALLLFWIQPMFAKMALPLLGGSPAVWNTAMLFFQATLLAGYGYAHLVTRRVARRWQLPLHLAVLGAACLALPIGLARSAAPPETTPTFWLIGLMAMSIGMPFFALAANAPLLQRWFSTTDHPTAADPYYLYGASNLGSMLALLAYPVIMEPLLRLHAQSLLWSSLYIGLVMLIAGCGMVAVRAPAGAAGRPAAMVDAVAPTWPRRMTWLGLSFVPASLLLGVTTHITTDIAAAPMFWVIPLALYLLTFVLVFARRPLLRQRWMLAAQPIAVFPILLLSFVSMTGTIYLILHLAAFFIVAMVCHGELASRRPAAARLTEFYLWMSLGGVLGGIFNALAAPALFDTVLEYPLILVLSFLARPSLPRPLPGSTLTRWFARHVDDRQADLVLPAALALATVAPLAALGPSIGDMPIIGIVVIGVVLACAGLAFSRRPLRATLAAAICLLTMTLISPQGSVTLDRERSFFGVYRVTAKQSGQVHVLTHGTTTHGAEYTDPAQRDVPLTYYHRAGPLGQMFAALDGQNRLHRVGVVGLGTGTVACYRKPGQQWTFFEIDPMVTRIARNERYFHYLADCAPDVPVVHGDARLSLRKVPDGQFDLLILDAFSSDSIPVHLMTREALLLYRDKLAPGGVLMFHISNRKLDLGPILANGAADVGMVATDQFFPVPPDAAATYRFASHWVALARSPADLALIDGDARWQPLPRDPHADLWTDDYSNIIGALRW